jgi:processive 1,2-diacylglycerol beta-glucosyltransferase
MTKKTLCLFTTVQGHTSISEAVKQVFEKDWNVQIFFERDDTFDFYVPIYQFFPGLFKIPFQIAKRKEILAFLHSHYKQKYQKKIQSFFNKNKPDICISIYYMYNKCLEEISEKNSIPFINVFTDPRTFHPLLISEKATTNLVFDTQAEEECKTGYPESSFQKVGWFVRDQYEQEYDKETVRQQLKLDPKVLAFLIVAGSEGTNVITTFLPFLLNTKKKLQVIVACGTNKTLFKSIKTLAQFLKKAKSGVDLIPLSFTSELHLYMQAADLVIGKAGPNTVFESVATSTPFFAITHIAGQEDGNLEIIQQYKLGYVEENPLKAGRLLKRLIQHPEELKSFTPSLKEMANYNKNSKVLLKKIVADLM